MSFTWCESNLENNQVMISRIESYRQKQGGLAMFQKTVIGRIWWASTCLHMYPDIYWKQCAKPDQLLFIKNVEYFS